MTCKQCRQELELLPGSDRLSGELQAHLDRCAECATYWGEQVALFDVMVDDSLFEIDATEVDSLVDRVNAQINVLSHDSAVDDDKIVSLPRMRRIGAWVAAAAAVIAMVGTGLVVQKFEQQTPAIVSVTPAEQDDLFALHVEGSDTTLGDTTVSALLYDYAHTKPYSASEELLSEISDEEWQYLESEFDLGGLL